MTPLADPKPRCWFEQWREPDEFHRAAHKALVSLPNENKKWTPQYFCDAFHAGCFALIWRHSHGPCKVKLMPESAEFPDAQVRPADHSQHIELEITMALDKGRRLYPALWELRTAKPELVTDKELWESAREAIPRAVKCKADRHYSGAKDLTLLIIANNSLSDWANDGGPAQQKRAEEMARLTEPWRDCFHAINLLSMSDVVMVWPELRVLSGKGVFR